MARAQLLCRVICISLATEQLATTTDPENANAAWQRALSQHGLTAGSCFAIYNPALAVPIEDDTVRSRLERRREEGYRAITGRMDQVGIERAYRIVGMLRDSAVGLEQEVAPEVERFARQWRKATLVLDALVFGSVLLLLAALTVWPGYLDGQAVNSSLKKLLEQNRYVIIVVAAAGLSAAGYLHYRLRRRAAAWVMRRRLSRIADPIAKVNYGRAFRKHSCWYRSIFFRRPTGWSRRSRRLLARLLESADAFIRKLNDAYTSPSGTAPIAESESSGNANKTADRPAN